MMYLLLIIVSYSFFITTLLYFVMGDTNRKLYSLKFLIANFLCIYLPIICAVFAYDLYLNYKLDSFDLNEGGFFSFDESTPEAIKYNSKVVNDTARNFAPVNAFIYCLFYAGLVSFFGCCMNLINKLRKLK